MMEHTSAQKYWHRLFELGIFLKGVNGVWETLGGVLFLFLSRAAPGTSLLSVTSHELLEDPNDVFINFLVQIFQNVPSDARTFAAVYLLAHGILNIFLTIQLYRDRHWAYLVTIGFTLFFMTYQIYRIGIHHSLFLAAVTIFDAIFVVLAWHEYKHHRERKIERLAV
ncbi:DUF2127 domain-containing protein [Candidatus Kaiserbacteria bacterium]|nr:DUF2127 domain-containing protein [Candidatus Kaiserbacteria bacterium]